MTFLQLFHCALANTPVSNQVKSCTIYIKKQLHNLMLRDVLRKQAFPISEPVLLGFAGSRSGDICFVYRPIEELDLFKSACMLLCSFRVHMR